MEIPNRMPLMNYGRPPSGNDGDANFLPAQTAPAMYFYPHIPAIVPPVPPTVPSIPPGLDALIGSCSVVYPDQLNPLQVTAVTKFWLGGPDPLDYISMYFNKGDDQEGIPPHWHYISFGLSDLHGDGRVHRVNTDPSGPSGFGFELTFRLKKETDEASPPTWPATVLQALAKYVFRTGNILCPGDHVSWHCPLDNSESRIQHMLIAEDSQLSKAHTLFGTVQFIQIVGVCVDELQAAQQWNGLGVIDLMKTVSSIGPHLITDMRRGESIFELDPELREAVDDGIATQGSNLSGVSAKCSYKTKEKVEKDKKESSIDDELETEKEKRVSTKENEPNSDIDLQMESRASSRNHSSMSVSHDRNSRMSFASETGVNVNIDSLELSRVKHFDRLHLNFNYEAGTLLPLVLRGRLKHGRHFTFKSIQDDLAITFVTASVAGSFVTVEKPYGCHGPWLQVLISEQFIDTMLDEMEDILCLDKENLPVTYRWKEINLSITLNPEEDQQPTQQAEKQDDDTTGTTLTGQ